MTQDKIICQFLNFFFLKENSYVQKLTLLITMRESRMKLQIINGLRPEYTLFVTTIQGWAQEPS